MAAETATYEPFIEPAKPVPYATLGSLTLDDALRPVEAYSNAATGLPGSTVIDWTPDFRMGGLDIEEE